MAEPPDQNRTVIPESGFRLQRPATADGAVMKSRFQESLAALHFVGTTVTRRPQYGGRPSFGYLTLGLCRSEGSSQLVWHKAEGISREKPRPMDNSVVSTNMDGCVNDKCRSAIFAQKNK